MFRLLSARHLTPDEAVGQGRRLRLEAIYPLAQESVLCPEPLWVWGEEVAGVSDGYGPTKVLCESSWRQESGYGSAGLIRDATMKDTEKHSEET